jgi:DNA-binding NarL/FixJ family response regulator
MDPTTVDTPHRRQAAGINRLTTRERDVLRSMAEGQTNSAIARRLFVSTKTIEVHVARIFDKLGIYQEKDLNRRVLAVIRWLHQDLHAGAAG